jgi:hypothetical protein
VSVLVLLLALALPVLIARLLATRTRAAVAVLMAAGFLPFVFLLWGWLARLGIVSSRFLITAATDFARAEQWAYLIGGCAVLFAVGLPLAWLAARTTGGR